MPTHPIYDQLLSEITDELERQVLETLMDEPAGIHRSRLIHKIYGVYVDPAELASNVYDRRIRKAIEALRKDWPIVSSSGEAGYKLSEDPDEINAYAAEQASRAARETERARQAHAWPAKIRTIHEYRRTNVIVEQPSLL